MWKQSVRAAWSVVRVEHIDYEGGDRHRDEAEISLDHSGLRWGCRQATAPEASGFGRRQPQESLHGR